MEEDDSFITLFVEIWVSEAVVVVFAQALILGLFDLGQNQGMLGKLRQMSLVCKLEIESTDNFLCLWYQAI